MDVWGWEGRRGRSTAEVRSRQGRCAEQRTERIVRPDGWTAERCTWGALGGHGQDGGARMKRLDEVTQWTDAHSQAGRWADVLTAVARYVDEQAAGSEV